MDRLAREVELGLEYGSPELNIDGQTWTFEDGHWITREIHLPCVARSTSVKRNKHLNYCCAESRILWEHVGIVEEVATPSEKI